MKHKCLIPPPLRPWPWNTDKLILNLSLIVTNSINSDYYKLYGLGARLLELLRLLLDPFERKSFVPRRRKVNENLSFEIVTWKIYEMNRRNNQYHNRDTRRFPISFILHFLKKRNELELIITGHINFKKSNIWRERESEIKTRETWPLR